MTQDLRQNPETAPDDTQISDNLARSGPPERKLADLGPIPLNQLPLGARLALLEDQVRFILSTVRVPVRPSPLSTEIIPTTLQQLYQALKLVQVEAAQRAHGQNPAPADRPDPPAAIHLTD